MAEIPITTIASTILAVEETAESVERAEALELTFLIAIAFGAIHIFYERLHHILYKEERIAISFGGGMAIAYIFLHLLPELEKGEQELGSIAHFVALIGFLLFYGLQRFAWRVSKNETSKYGSVLFYIELGFSSLYNFLLIYAIPELFEQNLLFVFLYVVAMGFHLLQSDRAMGEKYHHQFNSLGRYVLLGTVVFALVVDIFIEPASELTADVLTAILAGSLLFNVFQEELPEPEHTSFPWFVAGVGAYCVLVLATLLVT